MMNPANPRPVNEVLDQIIRENRPSEWLCYVLIVVFVVVGVVVIILGLHQGVRPSGRGGWDSGCAVLAGAQCRSGDPEGKHAPPVA